MKTYFAFVRKKDTTEEWKKRAVTSNGKAAARVKLEEAGLEVKDNKVRSNPY